MHSFWYNFIIIFAISFQLLSSSVTAQNINDWKTDLSKKSIELNELQSGGPPKDGIPSIDNPIFISQNEADKWVESAEPVIAFTHRGEARAYPLQILIWHEIVNDRFNDTPVLITFCPLCYSAIVFDRRIKGETHEFGVSGFLRQSDMIMFDRKTESLWQQFTGEAIVGDYTGKQLNILPSQIISFNQFREAYPDGKVLSRDTGYDRSYGTNPYTGYDDINNSPFLLDESPNERLKPIEKVIGVRVDNKQRAYPYSITEKEKIINDSINETPIVIFHTDGARSALDAKKISQSREDGSTGVFRRLLDNQVLTFSYDNGNIKDDQTGSIWNISGMATEGSLEGQQLEQLIFGDYFAFAWLVFWPETEIYTQD